MPVANTDGSIKKLVMVFALVPAVNKITLSLVP
jgi:hypothetical protein